MRPPQTHRTTQALRAQSAAFRPLSLAGPQPPAAAPTPCTSPPSAFSTRRPASPPTSSKPCCERAARLPRAPRSAPRCACATRGREAGRTRCRSGWRSLRFPPWGLRTARGHWRRWSRSRCIRRRWRGCGGTRRCSTGGGWPGRSRRGRRRRAGRMATTLRHDSRGGQTTEPGGGGGLVFCFPFRSFNCTYILLQPAAREGRAARRERAVGVLHNILCELSVPFDVVAWLRS